MIDTSGHHIVYGTLRDYLTGEELPDTDDERYRQQLARILVEKRGYQPVEIQPRLTIDTVINGQVVSSVVEYTISLAGRRVLIIRYGPGSLVTRERPAIAAARILESKYRIPLAVVTNLRDAELLETKRGEVLATGMQAIPSREKLAAMMEDLEFESFPEEKAREWEARILNTYDAEVCCHGSKCTFSGEPTDKGSE